MVGNTAFYNLISDITKMFPKSYYSQNWPEKLTFNGAVEDSMLVIRPDFMYWSVLVAKNPIASIVIAKITIVQIIFHVNELERRK